MATIRDVAKLAEVSVATVSAVINKDSDVNVSDRLTKKVEDAIDKLNYRPNRIARSLSKKENYTLGYIVPSITNEFFPQLAKVVEDTAFKKNYGVYLCNTEGSVKRASYYLDSLIENRVAGIITTLTWEIEKINFINNILNQNIPIVGLAGTRNNTEIDTVIPDDLEGGRLAAEHLIKKGYKNIGFIGIKDSQTTKVRLKGFYQAFLETDKSCNKNYIKFCNSFSNKEFKDIYRKMITEYPEIDAICVYNDLMASGIMDVSNEMGYKIPEDIALIGFDDSIASFTFPKMTTMRIPKDRMAELAMEMLFRRINGDKGDPLQIKITPELIERETTSNH
ncbi:MAG: LacI family DNA-binding transcriptional regulator [Halothermotrichaceae bacterium]